MRGGSAVLRLLCSQLLLSIPAWLKQLPAHNANHVFNAIHSSARQWGSSLNHNGMSVFLATVPAGTQLYHGGPYAEFVRGLEWLALEPEHALVFARPPLRPAEDRRGESHENIQDGESIDDVPNHGMFQYAGRLEAALRHRAQVQQHFLDNMSTQHLSHKEQQFLGPASSQSNTSVGYLHIYAPKHDLRLLYVDGISAGKTGNGTLDSQDMLLLNDTIDPHSPFGGEFQRARGMCELAATQWEGKIDGIMRMEGGFEIILCDFEKDVERIDLVAIKPHNNWSGMLGDWAYMKAITSRYHGIGGGRVTLDYDSFVSVFAYPQIEGLFENDVESDYPMPRLENVDRRALATVRDDITDMILRKDWERHMSTRNWQAAADLVVARYGEPLHFLHTNKRIRLNQSAFEAYLANLLRPFIDYTARDNTLETQRCIAQVVPAHGRTGLAYHTIRTISYRVCDTLLAALSAVSTDAPDDAIGLVDTLVEYLQWTAWKDCGGCQDDEICYIPIWPMGRHEDHAHPRCRSEATARERWGYWGFPRQNRPPPKGDEDMVESFIQEL